MKTMTKHAPKHNISRRSLIDKTPFGLSTIFRTTEVQIAFILLVIGFLTIYGKTTFNFSFTNPFMSMIDQKVFIAKENKTYQYSFDEAKFGFSTKLKDLKKQTKDQSNLELKFFKSLPSNIRLKAKPYIKAILKVSEIYQVDPIWVASVIWTESHFNSGAVSRVGALGLMQIMPKTKTYLYKKLKKKNGLLLVEKASFKVENFFDSRLTDIKPSVLIQDLVHIELGVFYLKKLLARFGHSHRLATIAYNMGPSWTRKRLSSNSPLGSNNHYLSKVSKAYEFISKSI